MSWEWDTGRRKQCHGIQGGAIAEYPATPATPCIRLRVYVVIALQVHWRQGYASGASVHLVEVFNSRSSL